MPIAIADGKGTPVTHTFTQDSEQQGDNPAVFVNRANVNGPSFWEKLLIRMKLGNKKTVPHLYKVELVRPIPGTVDGNPAVLGIHRMHLTLLADQAVASEADVLDSLVLVANLADNATFRGQFKQFAPAKQ
jgi:hypothetical protein